MKVKRPIVVVGDVAIVPLTKGKRAIVDVQDVRLVHGRNWFVHSRSNSLFYAVSWLKRGQLLLMHRVISQPPNDAEVDHINHDGLDNRRSNLRFGTHGHNLANQRYISSGTSLFRGVCWNKRHAKWEAFASWKSKTRRLGYFLDETEAAKAYDDAALESYGEFASLNFPKRSLCAGLLVCLQRRAGSFDCGGVA